MTPPLRWTVGKLNPSITGEITVDGLPVDLTGKTVRFQMRREGSAVLKVDEEADVTSAAQGLVRYDWQAADLNEAGDFVAWWEVSTAGRLQDTPEVEIIVREHADTGALCSVADLKAYLELETDAKDAVLGDLILAASAAITEHAQREFAPGPTEARDFEYRGAGVLDLNPCDLQTGETIGITIDPLGDGPTILAATDWRLLPMPNRHGVANMIRLPGYHVGYPTTVRVTGTWGFPAVPAAVKQAAIVTAGLWARREVLAFTATFNLDEARIERPEALPSAVRAMLAPYRRMTVV